jgi:hypothetical protein
VFLVEQAVKRARSGKQQNGDDDKVLTHMRALVAQLDGNEWSPSQSSVHQGSGEAEVSSSEDGEEVTDQTPMSEFGQRNEESLAVDDAENPLQLLARASYFQPSRDVRSRSSPQNTRRKGATAGESFESTSLEAFFTGAKVNLDVGSDIDPVDLGLVTEEEADSLFS